MRYRAFLLPLTGVFALQSVLVGTARAGVAAAGAPACAPYAGEIASALESKNPASTVVTPGGIKLDPTRLPDEFFVVYHQTHPMEIDPLGDVALASLMMGVPKTIAWKLMGKSEKLEQKRAMAVAARDCAIELFDIPAETRREPVEVQEGFFEQEGYAEVIGGLKLDAQTKEAMAEGYRKGELYLEGHRKAIREKEFTEMLVNVIAEEFRSSGTLPLIGRVHQWSKQFRKRFASKYGMLPMSKLLAALSRGDTARFMMTGAEGDFERWVLEQPLRSVTFDQAFRTSYRLNRGNVYLSLLTIENVFARDWRVADRERLPVTLRLKSIMNRFGTQSDDFGSWYHLTGIMLYGYATGALKAMAIGNIESLGSHILDHGADEKQEDYVNSQGGRIGAGLLRAIQKKRYLKIKPDASKNDPSYYLDLNEDFSKRLEKSAKRFRQGRSR